MFYIKLKNKDIPDINELLRRQDCPGIIISDKIPKDWSVYGAYDAAELVSVAALFSYSRFPNKDYPTGRIAELGGLYTLFEYRRRGIMKELCLIMIENIPKDLGNIDAIVCDSNPLSQHILLDIGFRDAVLGEKRLWLNSLPKF